MKMLNCTECGLTIPDSEEKCPKCHTKIETILEEVKEQEETSIREEISIDSTQVITTDENLIAENIETADNVLLENETDIPPAQPNEDSLDVHCEICESKIDSGLKLCETCEVSEAEINAPIVKKPKTDAQANRFYAALGYVFFFIPMLILPYKKSEFLTFHAKQAQTFFFASVVFYVAIMLFTNFLTETFFRYRFYGNHLDNYPHGFGGSVFFVYLRIIIYILHFIPFLLMAIGIFNALTLKTEDLPITSRFVKLTNETESSIDEKTLN